MLLMDMFVRGVACGAALLLMAAVWRSAVDRHARIATALFCTGVIAWLITESEPLWRAFGHTHLILLLAYPMAGFFWLFVLAVFADRPITWRNMSPASALLVSGVIMTASSPPWNGWLWTARNLFGGVLILHVGFIVVQGWRDDMIETRRQLRSVILGAAVVFGIVNLIIALQSRVHPVGVWFQLLVGQAWGGRLIAILLLAAGAFFLTASPSLFGPSRRAAPSGGDTRTQVAERLELARLETVMATEIWRREGLSIGDLAAEVGVPEHRLRKFINGHLGYRNFAAFLNARRIEAAKARLSDPLQARTTIAVIAFELGYGSLGPFNRAFRAVTGATPTEWRQRTLGQALADLQQAG